MTYKGIFILKVSNFLYQWEDRCGNRRAGGSAGGLNEAKKQISTYLDNPESWIKQQDEA